MAKKSKTTWDIDFYDGNLNVSFALPGGFVSLDLTQKQAEELSLDLRAGMDIESGIDE